MGYNVMNAHPLIEAVAVLWEHTPGNDCETIYQTPHYLIIHYQSVHIWFLGLHSVSNLL